MHLLSSEQLSDQLKAQTHESELDGDAIDRLARYCARPPLSLHRIAVESGRPNLVSHSAPPRSSGGQARRSSEIRGCCAEYGEPWEGTEM